MDALADAIDDGKVSINGQQYTVNATLAHRAHQLPGLLPPGSVGRTAFPTWSTGSRSSIRRIRGSTFGGCTRRRGRRRPTAVQHAAAAADPRVDVRVHEPRGGGLVAHTLVNEFGQGVFPDVVDLTDPQKAAIAARHILVEGYIGDATPGFDGNPDRTTLGNGDVSDDSTPAISFNAPVESIYDALVKTEDNFPKRRAGDAPVAGEGDRLLPGLERSW